MDRVKRIWYLSPMRAAKVQASLRIRAVSPEPPLLAHTSSESRGTFRQKARSLAPLNGWACAVKICHDEMLEDTNSLDGAQLYTINAICPVSLQKGNGYHLDMLVVAICIAICSLFGLPWFVAATVSAIAHIMSLKKESECAAPGEKPIFLGCR